MLKKLVCIFSFCCSALLFCENPLLLKTIDFSNIETENVPGYHSLSSDEKMHLEEIAEVCIPFNEAKELIPYFNYLKNAFDLHGAVETGTWKGETTKCFSFLFDEVHTMEIQIDVFQKAVEMLQPYHNIKVHYGNSPDILKQILPSLKQQRLLFYLDAHWFSNWPLLKELEAIGKTHRDNCVIVIDDFKVPNRKDIPYDAYNTKECSYKYIKTYLSKVFTSYAYYYVIPKSVSSRAKFVVIPKQWVNKLEDL